MGIIRNISLLAAGCFICGARGAPSEASDATPTEIHAGRFDHRAVSLHGTIRDVFRDEIDPKFLVVTLSASGETVYCFLNDGGREDPVYRSWPRATVVLRGVVCPDVFRYCFRHLGHTVTIPSARHVTVLKTDDAAIPDITPLRTAAPSEIIRADRHRATGRVLATWTDGFILRTADGDTCSVSLATHVLPSVGESVRAVGFPETDLYHVNLTRADWERADSLPAPPDVSTNVTIASISRNDAGMICFKPWFHGRLIRLRGKVRPADRSRTGTRFLDDGTGSVLLDASSHPSALTDIPEDTTVEATGICVLAVDTWRPNAAFPQIGGFRLVVRGPDDVAVVARPSWWTAQRLAWTVYALLALLAGILTVLLILRRLLAKRSRELEQEIGARIESECLVQERTRLAVELHDSVTQNLTGASLELRAAARAADGGPSGVSRNLELARKTVDSSLGGLRNCIWDLRNRALEEKDFSEAIRITLRPHVDDVDILIRFNVPREILSDNAAHAILSVIRELTVNAIRHGHASRIRIAGAIERERILFSVRDNGCGFDPLARPGVRQGHFGLQGVTERLKAFGGILTIDSRPGGGTKATVSIGLPREFAR